MQWVDNGPGWLGVLLASPDRVLALDCGPIDQFIGVAAARDDGSLEVRAFYPVRGAMVEDLPSLAYTPARARRVLINAQAGAPWRADFGIAGPTRNSTRRSSRSAEHRDSHTDRRHTVVRRPAPFRAPRST